MFRCSSNSWALRLIFEQGNLEELNNVDLEGHSVAAIEDCSQRFQVYFDFAQLDEIQKQQGPDRPSWLPDKPFNRSACVFNRGVLVIDNHKWEEENITKAIVWWMDEFRKSDKKALYKYALLTKFIAKALVSDLQLVSFNFL